MEIDEQGRRRS